MIFTSNGTRISITEFTDIIHSGERVVLYLYENNKWYKYSYVRDMWEETKMDISHFVED